MYPEGILASNQAILFNHEQIATISHLGLDDDEFKALNEVIEKNGGLDDCFVFHDFCVCFFLEIIKQFFNEMRILT